MRLTDLDPTLKAGHLTFRCPMCGDHMIRIPVADKADGNAWSASGTLENLTVKPSIRSETKPRCLWHGYVTDGAIITLSDSKLSP